jgi:hypothetical protein
MSHDDSMEPCLCEIRQVEREWLRTSSVEKQAVGMCFDPAFGTPDLVGGLEDRPAEPATPVELKVAASRELAILVRKNDDILFKSDEEVADLLPVPLARPSLVTVDAGITPERQEGLVTKPFQITFSVRNALGTSDARLLVGVHFVTTLSPQYPHPIILSRWTGVQTKRFAVLYRERVSDNLFDDE